MSGSTVSELQSKEVINICDSTRMGCVDDVYVDLCSGRVTAIVVPGTKKLSELFKKREDIVIPWSEIKNIGDDIILVEHPIYETDENIKIWKSK